MISCWYELIERKLWYPYTFNHLPNWFEELNWKKLFRSIGSIHGFVGKMIWFVQLLCRSLLYKDCWFSKLFVKGSFEDSKFVEHLVIWIWVFICEGEDAILFPWWMFVMKELLLAWWSPGDVWWCGIPIPTIDSLRYPLFIFEWFSTLLDSWSYKNNKKDLFQFHRLL